MSLSSIRAALISGYNEVGLDLDTAYENRSFLPGEYPWASAFLIPNIPDAVTVGIGGEDEHSGFLQVDLNYPLNEGTAHILEAADQIRAHFVAGRKFTHDGQEVLIRSCGRSTGLEINGWYRISMTINWTARTLRSL